MVAQASWQNAWLCCVVGLFGAMQGSALHAQSATTAWERIEPYCSPPSEYAGLLRDVPSVLRTSTGELIATPAQWAARRDELRADWTRMLGTWPPFIARPEVEILAREARENFEQLTIRFRWTPHELTTGYLLIPHGAQKAPAVLCVYYEPETGIGLGMGYRDYALQLARRGFVTLSLGTTEASVARTYAIYYPGLEHATVQPLSMLGYAAANAWHVLAQRPEVDADRIGIVGHSFGGKWAMFASCLFDRFACAVWSDPGIMFDDSRPSINYWEPWYLGYHPQPWRKRGLITSENPAFGLYPYVRQQQRNLHELHALMAPRPFLVSGGSEDPPERWLDLNHARAINDLLGYDDRVAMTNRPDHSPNQESNAVVYEFFEHWLKEAPRE